MKKLSIIFIFFSFISFGQTLITVTPNNNPRVVPKIGYNSNALTMPSIYNKSFVDSLKKLEVPIFRFPGGTNSQYWDWQNGKSLPITAWVNNGGSLQNFSYLGTTPMVPLKLKDLKRFIDSMGAKPLFVLNVLSRSLTDQMDMLREAKKIGLEVDLIELGNEMFFEDADFVSRFPTAGIYAREMNIWSDSIKNQFPNSKIAIIGSTTMPTMPNGNPMPNRIRYWNDSIFKFYKYSDAITQHYYFRHNNTAQTPNPTQVLSNAFSEWQNVKPFYVDNINNGIDIWFTEYNLNDDFDNYRVATTWLHGLFTSAIHLQLLESSKVGMILNHQITGGAPFASLNSYTNFGDTFTNRLTAEGNAMRIIHKAYRNAELADKLIFSINPTITYNSSTYPSLVGWTFYNNDSNIVKMIILNVSENSFSFNTNNLSNESFYFETITSNNLTSTNITTANLTVNNGKSSNINIPSYSVTLLEEDSTKLINTSLINEQQSFKLYPNPANSNIYIDFNNNNSFKEINIFNINGQKISKKTTNKEHINFEIKDYPTGLYIVQINQNNSVSKQKFIKY